MGNSVPSPTFARLPRQLRAFSRTESSQNGSTALQCSIDSSFSAPCFVATLMVDFWTLFWPGKASVRRVDTHFSSRAVIAAHFLLSCRPRASARDTCRQPEKRRRGAAGRSFQTTCMLSVGVILGYVPSKKHSRSWLCSTMRSSPDLGAQNTQERGR